LNKVNFDDYARQYETLANAQTRLFDGDSTYFARYKVDLMKAVSGAKPRAVMDFGCGIGLSLPHLRNAFPDADIVGCDPSEGSLSVARKRGVECRLDVPDNIEPKPTFDLVLASCVFHHIQPAERQGALKYCLERLKPGGQMFVFEHNPFNPVTRHFVNTCPFDTDAILLRRDETVAQMRQAGFRAGPSSYCLFFPKALSFLRSLETALGWLPLGGQYYVAGVRP